MRRNSVVFGLVLAAAFAGMARAEQTLESVEKEVEGLWSKITSFSATVTSDTTISMGPATMKSHATGTMDCLKAADAAKFRMDMINKMDAGIPGVGAMEQKVLSVFDGDNLYSQIEAMGTTQASKMSADSAKKQGPLVGKSMFEGLKQQGDLTLLADATVDSKPVYVVEVKPNSAVKSSSPMPVGKIKSYISKENGLQLKMEVFDEKEQPISTTTYTGIKTNVTFSEGHFVYKAPAGVTVMDMSNAKLPGTK